VSGFQQDQGRAKEGVLGDENNFTHTHTYDDNTMKPTKQYLKRGLGGLRKYHGGDELIQKYTICIHGIITMKLPVLFKYAN
jgi:hypothetical protein